MASSRPTKRQRPPPDEGGSNDDGGCHGRDRGPTHDHAPGPVSTTRTVLHHRTSHHEATMAATVCPQCNHLAANAVAMPPKAAIHNVNPLHLAGAVHELLGSRIAVEPTFIAMAVLDMLKT